MLRVGDIKNYTPHDIHIYDIDYGAQPVLLHTIAKSGRVLRLVETKPKPSVVEVCSVPVFRPPEFLGVKFGSGEDARVDELTETMIVSALVAEWLQTNGLQRAVFSPSTGPAHVVRDTSGRIIGTQALLCFSPFND